MGFWDSGFGTPYNKSNNVLVDFYKTVYFDFGLTSPYALRPNAKVPVGITQGLFSNHIASFEIHGNVLEPLRFMGNGWDTVFNKISRNIPIGRGYEWEYDVTRLPEGILKGRATLPSTGRVEQSDEYLKILRLLGASVRKQLSLVPAIQLGFGHTWGRYRIPDSIHVGLRSMYPFTDSDFQRTINLILHNYRDTGAPVTASYSWNPDNGTLEILVTENIPHQESVPDGIPVSMPEFINDLNEFVASAKAAQASAPEAPAMSGEPEDGFPYDFYRGLGLIDGENMVAVPSVLGPIRIPMTEDIAKAHLLAYQPEN